MIVIIAISTLIFFSIWMIKSIKEILTLKNINNTYENEVSYDLKLRLIVSVIGVIFCTILILSLIL